MATEQAEPHVLVVQHQADCPPGLLGLWLDAAGCELDVRHPYAGEPLPTSLRDHDALVVLGGSMSATDDVAHAWLPATKELLRTAASTSVPALGICLGHQLAAVALGGAVEPNPSGRQLGVLAVGWAPEAAGDPLLDSRPAHCLHSNDDVVVALPAGAVALAHAPDGTVQAARFAETVWGVQPHPEVEEAILARWAAAERPELGDAFDAVMAELHRAGPELARTWWPVATAFARLAGGR